MAKHEFVLAGVIGWPVAHSRSPGIHNHWIEAHGLNGRYVALPVDPVNLPAALRGLAALGFAGCNVTIPHKVAALQLVDDIDAVARRIGAINTIVVRRDGSLAGSNNDAFGYIQSLLDEQPGWTPGADPIAVIGAGGGARAVIAALSERGATEIRVCNRSPERSLALEREFGAPLRAVGWEQRHDALEDVALLVNTTSQGMSGQAPLELTLDRLPVRALVSDLVYVPLETPLLAAARRRGNRTVGGLGMLLNQARPAFHAWFGVLPQITPKLRQLVQESL